MSLIIAPLPAALTPKQFSAHVGISDTAVRNFMQKHPESVVPDQGGHHRILREYADAYTLGTVDELKSIHTQWGSKPKTRHATT